MHGSRTSLPISRRFDRADALSFRAVFDAPAQRGKRVAQTVGFGPLLCDARAATLLCQSGDLGWDLARRVVPLRGTQSQYGVETIDSRTFDRSRQIASDQFPQHGQRAWQIQILIDFSGEARKIALVRRRTTSVRS